jgi:hypothetical protein
MYDCLIALGLYVLAAIGAAQGAEQRAAQGAKQGAEQAAALGAEQRVARGPEQAAEQDPEQPAAQAAVARSDPHAVVHGMTVSCPTWGVEWGSDAMSATLEDLSALGVNWIAIHPYAGIAEDGSVSWRAGLAQAEWLTRPIAEAHARGQKLLIKPHLAYWGTRFAWAGAIEFDTDAQWQRFFDGYERWIAELVAACRDADAFCVGTELDRTVGHAAEWRRVIAAARAVAGAKPLTYASNWDAYERVDFWDALDAICVHGYFPLAAAGAAPSDAELAAGARAWVERLADYGRAHRRNVLVGELGYDVSPCAAERPWERRRWPRGGSAADQAARASAEQLQARCLDAALQALERNDVVVGAFLWKWFPEPAERARVGGDFRVSTPALREVIARHWRAAAGAAAPAR